MNASSLLRARILSPLVLVVAFACGGSSSAPPAVAAPPGALVYAQNPAVYPVGAKITDNTATVSGEVTGWAVTPVLPAGLVLNSVTGTISGTPTQITAMTTYVITASNSGGETTAQVQITVFGPPSNLSYAPNNPYPVGWALRLPPTVTGTVDNYELTTSSPNLPAGLRLDLASGIISGRPFVPTSGPVTVTVKASNAAGSTTADVLFQADPVPSARAVYVTNSNSDTLSIYRYDATNRRVTHAGFVATGDGPADVAVSPDGSFVYVTNHGADTISIYRADAVTGDLTPVGTATTGDAPSDIYMHPSGRFLYVANYAGSNVSKFVVSQTTGELTEITPAQPALPGPYSMAGDSLGKFLYVANSIDKSIGVYRIDPNTGDLTDLEVEDQADEPLALAVDPSNRYLYAASGIFFAGKIHAYVIQPDGKLEVMQGSPFSLPSSLPSSIAVTDAGPAGWVYVTNSPIDTVSLFRIHPDTGVLEAQAASKLTPSRRPNDIVFTPQNDMAFIVGNDSNDLSTHLLDANQSLKPTTKLPELRTQVAPTSVAVAPSLTAGSVISDFLYATNEGSDSVSAYSLDSRPTGNGTPAPVAGSPFAAGKQPIAATFDPSNKFLYTANAGGGVSLFAVNQTTGLLTTGKGIGLGAFRDVLVGANGRFAFGVIDGNPGSIQPYAIDAKTGELSDSGLLSIATGKAPQFGAVDPTGRFLYVPNKDDGTVSAYKIADTGALAAIGAVKAGTGPTAIVVHPSGKYAYVCNNGSNDVSQYSIHKTSGALSALSPPSVKGPTANGDATDIAIHWSGEFVYVANGTTNEMLLFRVQSDGTLKSVKAFQYGQGPIRGVAIDATGRFLYTAQESKSRVRTSAIDPASGDLTIESSEAASGTATRGLTTTNRWR